MIRLALLAALLAGCLPADPPPMAPVRTAGGPAPGAGLGDEPLPRGDQGAEPGNPTPTEPTKPLESDPMRALEAELVVVFNRVRADPPAFAADLATYRSYYDEMGRIHFPGREVAIASQEGAAAVDEAITAAKKASPASVLAVSAGLSRAAREHAAEIGAAGTIDHVNSKMEQPHHRMEKYGAISGYSGENIGTGDEDALAMALLLFVDDGVPSRGHRINLLTKAYRKVGIGCAEHIYWNTVCVIDMAEGYTER